MKNLTVFLLTIGLCFGLCFTACANEKYYQGDAHYPIAFVQWGEGYVLDLFTARELAENTIIADAHIVNLETQKMSPRTLFVAAKFNPSAEAFTIAFQKAHGRLDFTETTQFDASYLNRGNSETGFIFRAGLLLWEAMKGKPFFAGDSLRLTPAPMSGSPTEIRVDEVTSYSRSSQNRAVVCMQSPSGNDFWMVLFTPDYFILEEACSQDETTQAALAAQYGKRQDYASNPHIDLVRLYMGFTEP